MEIRLSPEVEAVVERDMASGRYASVDDYIAEAVAMLHERQQWRVETLDELNASLEASIAESERGELLDEDEVRRRMNSMKEDWARRQTV